MTTRGTRTLTWDGYLPEQTWVCAAVVCHFERGVTTALEERDNVYNLGVNPPLVSAEFTLTWDDWHADVQEVYIGLWACTDEACDDLAAEAGTSGVTVAADDLVVEGADELFLIVWHTSTWTTAGGVQSGAPVNFTVDGAYDVQVPGSGV